MITGGLAVGRCGCCHAQVPRTNLSPGLAARSPTPCPPRGRPSRRTPASCCWRTPRASRRTRSCWSCWRAAARAAAHQEDWEEAPAEASLGEKLQRCSLEVVPDLPSIEVVLMARLAKKAVLSQLAERLLTTCEN